MAHPVNAPAAPLLGFGIDGGGEIILDPTVRTLAANSGARWIRQGVWWSSFEPVETTPATYSWGVTDDHLKPLIQAGLKPVVLLTNNPAWASAFACGPIDTKNSALLSRFGDAMAALAQRYPEVPVWVLYNEADNASTNYAAVDGCFGDDASGDINHNGVPDVQEYAIEIAKARDRMHAVNPNTNVAINIALDNFDHASCPPNYPGGCPSYSTFNYNFLPNLLAYMHTHPRVGGAPYADLLAFNYYDIYGHYWESRVGTGYKGIQAKTQFIRTLMRKAKVQLKMLVTETGEHSDSNWVGLDGQSQCLVTEMVMGSSAGLQGVGWWTLPDIPMWGWYYGIIDSSLQPKPSYKAFQVLAQQLDGYMFDKSLSTPKVAAYQFVNGKRKMVVAWSLAVSKAGRVPCADTRKNQNFTFFKVKKLQTVDIYAQTTTLVVDNKKGDHDKNKKEIKIKIGSKPTYINLNP